MEREKGAESQGSPERSQRQGGSSDFGNTAASEDPRRKGGSEAGDGGGAIPDFIRRAMAFGFTGFFATEEAMRRALGDTMPKDWVDFAAEQSDRTRGDLTDRFAKEFGKILEQVDLVQLMSQLLEGRSIEVNASIRLGPERSGQSEGESAAMPQTGGRNFHTDLNISTQDDSSPPPKATSVSSPTPKASSVSSPTPKASSVSSPTSGSTSRQEPRRPKVP